MMMMICAILSLIGKPDSGIWSGSQWFPYKVCVRSDGECRRRSRSDFSPDHVSCTSYVRSGTDSLLNAFSFHLQKTCPARSWLLSHRILDHGQHLTNGDPNQTVVQHSTRGISCRFMAQTKHAPHDLRHKQTRVNAPRHNTASAGISCTSCCSTVRSLCMDMAQKGADVTDDDHREETADGEGENEGDGQSSLIDKLGRFFESLKVKSDESQALPEVSVDGLVKYLLSDKCKRVIAMVGAGMSTSAGIPDFRSPGSGIYANLQQYDLPSPEAIFEISYFRQHPEPFFHLARDLFPSDDVRPTPSHMFLKLLSDKGLLQRVYTQNIDCLERAAGIPESKIVEAHGSFHVAHCLNPVCRKEYSFDWIKSKVLTDRSTVTVPKCETCDTIVKPDIVFFGEALPGRFFQLVDRDFPECDLLIVIGTSLCVQPFASLLKLVPDHVPRLVINLTTFRRQSRLESLLGVGSSHFDFDSDSNRRDIFMQGRCDDMCRDLARRLGWEQELGRLVKPDQ